MHLKVELANPKETEALSLNLWEQPELKELQMARKRFAEAASEEGFYDTGSCVPVEEDARASENESSGITEQPEKGVVPETPAAGSGTEWREKPEISESPSSNEEEPEGTRTHSPLHSLRSSNKKEMEEVRGEPHVYANIGTITRQPERGGNGRDRVENPYEIPTYGGSPTLFEDPLDTVHEQPEDDRVYMNVPVIRRRRRWAGPETNGTIEGPGANGTGDYLPGTPTPASAATPRKTARPGESARYGGVRVGEERPCAPETAPSPSLDRHSEDEGSLAALSPSLLINGFSLWSPLPDPSPVSMPSDSPASPLGDDGGVDEVWMMGLDDISRFTSNTSSKRTPGQPNKLSPISDLWAKWTEILPKLFNPGRDICVDEQLVSFRGRCSFKQYIPSKPAKYGIKVWAVCDVETSYALSLEVYTGKPPGGPRTLNVGMNVVLRLCNPYVGHTVTCDNFFTSIPLAEQLRKKKIALVGTLRKNKKELPPALLRCATRQPLSSLFAFTQHMTIVSYMPKKSKNVLVLSSKHREPVVTKGKGNKPQIILDYNKCKGAVDHLDQACGTYSSRRRALRWPMCLFSHMLDVSSYNAYVLFSHVEPTWNERKLYKRRLFLCEVAKALVTPEIERRMQNAQSNVHGTAAAPERPLRRRHQCGLCTKKLQASHSCAKCGVAICNAHLKRHCLNC
ncbi:uncharacterized protein LOC144013470 [Festucalex cinctus]